MKCILCDKLASGQCTAINCPYRVRTTTQVKE